ncbi:hypothetical protein [Sphingobacterium multivorum]|uniref:hypothetical protein n=1 Tax=Sphingobacterium multivorum TaxID=28454 RepID=UPI0028A79A45|nr:hypothetical protein [Sphingobacterium multivorum]
MRFAKLNDSVLKELQSMGYNVLIAPFNCEDSENITWKAITVPNVFEWLVALDCEGITAVPFEEPNILVIQDALNNIKEEDLKGNVFIER